VHAGGRPGSSANKVSQRIRQQITRKTVEEFEETTKHGINWRSGVLAVKTKNINANAA